MLNISLENYCCPKNLMVRRKNFMEQYRQIVTKILHFFLCFCLVHFLIWLKAFLIKSFFIQPTFKNKFWYLSSSFLVPSYLEPRGLRRNSKGEKPSVTRLWGEISMRSALRTKLKMSSLVLSLLSSAWMWWIQMESYIIPNSFSEVNCFQVSRPRTSR